MGFLGSLPNFSVLTALKSILRRVILWLSKHREFAMADILDPEARVHRSLAFKKSGHSLICDLCRDTVLGCSCRHFPSAAHLLEALSFPDGIA